MLDVPSRELLAALTTAAEAIAPIAISGLAADTGHGRIRVTYSFPLGMGAYGVPLDELSDVFLPLGDEIREMDSEVLAARGGQPVEWHAALAGARRLLSVPLERRGKPVRFWMGLRDADAPVQSVTDAIAAAVRASAPLIEKVPASELPVEQLRRLESASALLPALLHVLDVRDVFERLSVIGKTALPHDLLTLGLFNDDFTTVTMYAQTGGMTGVFPQPYPPAVVRAWEFDLIDDRREHPLERDRPPTKLGMRSSVRVALMIDDEQIGGLAFMLREPGRYTSADVAVGRRLADYVALAVSHQRVAEQARQHHELQARAAKSDLLDEVLASLTMAGTLPEVFDRISAAVQKVLPHDAMVLPIVQPNRAQARIYASKAPDGLPFPDVIDVPPMLQANPNWDHQIVADLQSEGDQHHLWITKNGYKSALRLPLRLDDSFVGGITFLSFKPGMYGPEDLPVAKRIVERIALRFARERGTALLQLVDEAAARASKLEARVRELTEELDAQTGYRRVLGQSKAWKDVLTQATQVAPTETTVLLLGESGTGKEVVARFLHRASARARGPFIALNCAALPEQLLEAELFGYERGAYTGATQSKPGQLEQAAGGTLLLDEVGEMSPQVQAKFLRVLQEREFQRLGGTRVLRSDARIVAATNRDLPRAIAQGQFREDLYYRLNVFAIRLPPLRDRQDDVLPLSEAFLEEISRGLGRPPAGISRDARALLTGYHWPGNVRELRNILERAAILCEGGLITAEHLSLTTAAPSPVIPVVARDTAEPIVPARSAVAGDLQTMERTMIEQALRDARFNKSKAAKAVGLTRHQLYIRMRKYGLE